MTDFAELPVEVRSADDAQRTATLIVCRYGETTRRTARPERFLPGAFTTSVTKKAHRILFTNRHTDSTGQFKPESRVARPVAWHTANPAELQATIKFFDDAAGWEAYDRARDGQIDAGSVGFQPVEERVAADGVREIKEAVMHHFALLSRAETMPAYDGPRLLEVRQSDDDLTGLLAVTYDLAEADACIDLDELHRMSAS